MKTGIFQCEGGGLEPAERLQRLAQALGHERSQGGQPLELVLCSELFASGYNIGDDLFARAEAPDGPFYLRVAELAQQFGTAIVYGYPERSEVGIHNAAAFVGASGEMLANHRKCLNAPGGFEDRYFIPGKAPTLLQYGGIRIALLICYEIEFPEAARAAARAGAQLILAPTALSTEWDVVASRVVPTRAFENGVWVAYANHAGHENGIAYLGGSKIVAPSGEICADAGISETLISCTVDADSVTAAQRRLPYLEDLAKLPAAPQT